MDHGRVTHVMTLSIFLILPYELNNAVIGLIAGVVTGATLAYLIGKQRALDVAAA